jgi:tRNA modification GTPase
VLDQALMTFFRGPDSYTGEDMVELSCHGGWLAPQLVLDACLEAGARQAEAGEFTRRAYLHGKLDLVQAEAVADLIEARSRASHRAALGQLERGLSERITELRQALIRLEAWLAHHLDFPEEDDAPVPLERVGREAEAVAGRLDAMLATAPEGELLREGALTVLAGRPNVGKSSLYNALLGEERAIVTARAGTTRDALEATVQLGGFPFRLVDTAGLRDTGEEVELLGIEVTRRYLSRADLVLMCVEAEAGLLDSETAFLDGVDRGAVVLVETKADLVPGAEGVAPAPRRERGVGADACVEPRAVGTVRGRVRVSTVTGEGMAEMKSLLPSLVYSGLVAAGGAAPVLTRRRHARALERARGEVASFRQALADGVPAEMAAAHLRTAETALEEVLGVISVDDVLDVVFREFCVGK